MLEREVAGLPVMVSYFGGVACSCGHSTERSQVLIYATKPQQTTIGQIGISDESKSNPRHSDNLHLNLPKTNSMCISIETTYGINKKPVSYPTIIDSNKAINLTCRYDKAYKPKGIYRS